MAVGLTFHKPETLAEATAILAKITTSGSEACLLAGGTAVVPELRESLTPAPHLISLQRISDLKRITLEDDRLRIGALVSVHELVSSPVVRQHAPVLSQAAGKVGGVQIRNMATIGGNLCNAAPYADLAVPLLLLDAAVLARSQVAQRTIPLMEFFAGPNQTVLKPHELISEITIPHSMTSLSAVYLKHTLRQAMGIGIVNVGLLLKQKNGICEDVRLALGAVAPTPIRAWKAESLLRGKRLVDKVITDAASLASEECHPADDIRGSAWYRRRMVKVLTERAMYQLLV